MLKVNTGAVLEVRVAVFDRDENQVEFLRQVMCGEGGGQVVLGPKSVNNIDLNDDDVRGECCARKR